MSYNFFNQVIPPTGVELCLSARFTSEDDVNLIVAKTNVLEVYTLHRHDDSKARRPPTFAIAPPSKHRPPSAVSFRPIYNKFIYLLYSFRPNSQYLIY
jgi:hypothetical protein